MRLQLHYAIDDFIHGNRLGIYDPLSQGGGGGFYDPLHQRGFGIYEKL